jgi:hypothetical protein
MQSFTLGNWDGYCVSEVIDGLVLVSWPPLPEVFNSGGLAMTGKNEKDDVCVDAEGEASAVGNEKECQEAKGKRGNDRSSTSTTSDSGKARGDAAKGKDRAETENDGDNGPGSD